MVRRRWAALSVVAVAVLSACADGVEPAPEDSPPPATGTPDGTDDLTPDASPAEQTPVIEVRDGQVQGGAPTIEAGVGETVRFRVVADVADVVHVHGFDHHFDVVPGEETVVEFTAEFAGQFEVELEESGLLVAELEIR